MDIDTNVFIIGQGSWGRRIKKSYGKNAQTWKHGQPGRHITGVDRIYVAVPARYLRETLKLFTIDRSIPVLSCTKGLDPSGQLPSQVIEKEWQLNSVLHLGGACIASEEWIFPIIGDKELELISVLKNVYAIGFNYVLEQEGINTAAVDFIAYLQEISIRGQEGGYADLLATCFSPKSRNARVGKALAQGKIPKLRGQIAEGLDTAWIIETHNLYRERPLLREITSRIANRAVSVYL